MTDACAGTLRLVRIAGLGAVLGLTAAVVVDLPLGLLCIRLPLWVYCGAGCIGGAAGVVLNRRFLVLRSGLRWALRLVAAAGLIAIFMMTVALPLELAGSYWPMGSWNSKCAHRYCERLLGWGLRRSPFPTGVPSCGRLHMCANELDAPDRDRALEGVLKNAGCDTP